MGGSLLAMSADDCQEQREMGGARKGTHRDDCFRNSRANYVCRNRT